MQDGDIDQKKTSISSDHAELIKKALNDPASLKGSMKITQGEQVLLHVKDGRVLLDTAGLTKPSAKIDIKTSDSPTPEVNSDGVTKRTDAIQTPDSPSQGLYERLKAGVSREGLQATQEIAEKGLKAGIDRETIANTIKAHDSSYQKLSQDKGDKMAEQFLEKLLDRAEAKQLIEPTPQNTVTQEAKISKGRSH